MRTERGFDRLITFADAVVAIALTLLVLPLVEIATYDGVLLRPTLVWLFTIVVLPFVTQLLAGGTYERGAAPVYDGVLLVSSLALIGMAWWGHRRPELLHRDSAEVREWLAARCRCSPR